MSRHRRPRTFLHGREESKVPAHTGRDSSRSHCTYNAPRPSPPAKDESLTSLACLHPLAEREPHFSGQVSGRCCYRQEARTSPDTTVATEETRGVPESFKPTDRKANVRNLKPMESQIFCSTQRIP
ncbi:hypothetical protein H920_13149 [Fukomys damarensis]|uniref:Uncharacterized protein n=1 Tax=Fukomys damarensis TaxID=885580 RepID=A0A091D4F2_FUKDA|nr:hypothetical protein H920_13149 [Fukomys damarensis]